MAVKSRLLSQPSEGVYADINAMRDTEWWFTNNTLWKAIDYLAAGMIFGLGGAATISGTIPHAGSVSYKAPLTCLVVASWHITANTNGVYETRIEDRVMSRGETKGAANCLFSEQWILRAGQTVTFFSSSTTDSEYRVLTLGMKS